MDGGLFQTPGQQGPHPINPQSKLRGAPEPHHCPSPVRPSWKTNVVYLTSSTWPPSTYHLLAVYNTDTLFLSPNYNSSARPPRYDSSINTRRLHPKLRTNRRKPNVNVSVRNDKCSRWLPTTMRTPCPRRLKATSSLNPSRA